jgi:GT2 family glycosyltransferase
MTKVLTIVIPCHNRREALHFTLDSLCQQTFPAEDFEVIVVDQASTDGARELASTIEIPYELHLIGQDAKYGISVSRNAGVEAANSPIVLFLDADLLADPGLVQAHVACHAASPGALVCGRVLPYPPAYTSFIDQAANPDMGLDRGDAEGPLPFYQAFGGHLSLTTDTFRRVGPFDPQLKGFEDIEFAYRAKRLGFPIVNCPRAISYHNHPRTLRERCARARAYIRMVPFSLNRYPELKGTIPLIRDLEPIRWREDSGTQLLKKLRVRVFGFVLVRWSFFLTLILLDRLRLLPRLVKILYWRLLLGNWYLGFREGLETASLAE